jgi:enhancing lycopene biosynthesis protein 2
MIRAKKPVGVICIAPAMMAKAIQGMAESAQLTIGNDQATAEQMEKLGVIHSACAVGDMVVDERYNIVSTPAYMLGQRISDVAEGINKLVDKVLSMIPS